MKEFIETRIIEAVRELLIGRVNELLLELDFHVPIIDFEDYGCGYASVPVIMLSSCERSEKERIIRMDVYTVTIGFDLTDTPESDHYCYAYSAVICKALGENPTLSGIVDNAVIIEKKYVQPKRPRCGEGWGVVLALRITVKE